MDVQTMLSDSTLKPLKHQACARTYTPEAIRDLIKRALPDPSFETTSTPSSALLDWQNKHAGRVEVLIQTLRRYSEAGQLPPLQRKRKKRGGRELEQWSAFVSETAKRHRGAAKTFYNDLTRKKVLRQHTKFAMGRHADKIANAQTVRDLEHELSQAAQFCDTLFDPSEAISEFKAALTKNSLLCCQTTWSTFGGKMKVWNEHFKGTVEAARRPALIKYPTY